MPYKINQLILEEGLNQLVMQRYNELEIALNEGRLRAIKKARVGYFQAIELAIEYHVKLNDMQEEFTRLSQKYLNVVKQTELK